jgi:hypothetical protein
VVRVRCGASVRREPGGFFEGTWSGPDAMEALGDRSTVFGSGIVTGDSPLVVTPAHGQAGVFAARTPGETLVSNSLAGLLAGAGLELDRSADYPGRFMRVIDGLAESPIRLPVTDSKIDFHFHNNLRVGDDGSLVPVAKPREPAFASYSDYRGRLGAALASAIANAPGYAPVVAASGGYDSTAVAVIAAQNDCRRMLTFPEARPAARRRGARDSGEPTAAKLGMDALAFDRLAYLQRDDLPEAEFLATGFSGEDVVFSAFEPHLRGALLITGGQGDTVWQLDSSPRQALSRSALDGCSLTEFRLRLDCVYVPLPVFGITEHSSIQAISRSGEMAPWSVGGRYDKPIPRRLAEEAGIERGRFADVKRAASSLIHSDGRSALSVKTVESIAAFAAQEGDRISFPGRRLGRAADRALVRLARLVGMRRTAEIIQRRQRRRLHFETPLGTLLLRWGVSVVARRYASLAPDADSRDARPSH